RRACLGRARKLGDLLLARFEDPEKGGFAEVASPRGDGGKAHRGGRKFDQNACAVRYLSELASISGMNDYRDAARRAGQAFEKNLDHAGADAADWALALRALKVPDLPPRPKWNEPKKTESAQPRVFRPSAMTPGPELLKPSPATQESRVVPGLSAGLQTPARRVVQAAWRRRGAIAMFVSTVTAAALVVSLMLPKWFTAETTVLPPAEG